MTAGIGGTTDDTTTVGTTIAGIGGTIEDTTAGTTTAEIGGTIIAALIDIIGMSIATANTMSAFAAGIG